MRLFLYKLITSVNLLTKLFLQKLHVAKGWDSLAFSLTKVPCTGSMLKYFFPKLNNNK